MWGSMCTRALEVCQKRKKKKTQHIIIGSTIHAFTMSRDESNRATVPFWRTASTRRRRARTVCGRHSQCCPVVWKVVRRQWSRRIWNHGWWHRRTRLRPVGRVSSNGITAVRVRLVRMVHQQRIYLQRTCRRERCKQTSALRESVQIIFRQIIPFFHFFAT